MVYHEWECLNDIKKIWSKFKEHFNEAFNELQELTQITAEDAGFGANVMELTRTIIDEILGALDSLANANVQKTDTVDILAVALCTATDEFSRLNKIIEPLTTHTKKTNKPQKDWDPKGYCWSHGYKVEL